MNFSKHISWLIHLTAWLFYILSPILLLPNTILQTIFREGFFILKLLEDVLIIAFFYTNYLYFTPQLLHKGQQLSFWLKLFLCFLGICFFSFFVGKYFIIPEPMMPFSGLPPDKSNMPVLPAMQLSFLPNIFRVIPAFIAAALISSLLVIIQDRLKMKAQKQEILLEKIASELEVLKLQISPYFLFNTLNNIRWLARQKSEKTEDTIVKLSSLLRYILYETKAEKVPLQNEIRNLEDYIALQKIRLTPLTKVDFSVLGSHINHTIEPLLFIPFVENAFNYGVHNQIPSNIIILLKTESNKIIFKTQNAIFEDHQHTNDEESGIGIKNVERRLKMIYPKNHHLQISDNGGIYSVSLEITFQND
jgi:LytS/YehU family sensor histidine kinase